MRKKARAIGARNRKQQKENDLAAADRRRALEKERAAAQRKKTIEYLRNGKTKLKKRKTSKGISRIFSLIPEQPKIRRADVVIDEHTTPKAVEKLFRLEGDTGWV